MPRGPLGLTLLFFLATILVRTFGWASPNLEMISSPWRKWSLAKTGDSQPFFARDNHHGLINHAVKAARRNRVWSRFASPVRGLNFRMRRQHPGRRLRNRPPNAVAGPATRQRPSSTSRTFFASAFGENGFWRNFLLPRDTHSRSCVSFRVPGNENRPQPRQREPEAPGQLHPAHLRHHHVGHQQVRRLGGA